MKDIKKKTVKGIAWTFIDRAGSQFIGFVITIFLARILSPAEFGLVAMASVVIAITRIFIDSGLRDSLIQKQDCTDIDYSTVFLFNLAMSILLFGIIFISAPWIASFFGYEKLTPLIRVLGLKPAIASFSIVQTAILHKELQFGKIAKVRIPAFILSGIIGLTLALMDYGVWSLIIQSLMEVFLFNLFLWLTTSWRPVFRFEAAVFRFHWRHGSRLLVVGALGAIYRNIFSLIIGKFFSPAQLGFYSRADSFRSIILNNSTGLIQTVSYPVLARLQHDNFLLKNTYRKILQATMFFLLPVIAILITGAEPIIEFLLTAKWLPAAPILIVLMISLVFSPFNSINMNILKVKRRTDLLLRTDIVNKMLLVTIVIVTVNLGFDYLVMTNLIIAILALFINGYYTNRLINYSVREQIIDLWPILLAFILSVGATVLGVQFFTIDNLFLSILFISMAIVSFYLVTITLIRKKYIFDMINDIKILFK